jgi:quercetin 2,3-dioxygenase
MQQAKIFLAEERGVTETEWFRSYNTLNFGTYYSQHKTPVEKLYVCNDDTLAGGKNFNLLIDEPAIFILLPVVGAVEFKINETVITVNAGQVFSTLLFKGDTIELCNPFNTGLINFLQFWIKTDDEISSTPQLLSFNIDDCKNNFVNTGLTVPVNIAKFDGRAETVYKTINNNNCLFAFVIQGAFEMEGILLHARDGVAFWNYKQAEIEALSNDAIIVVLEMEKD